MIFKKFKWTAAKRLNWNNEGQWLGTKDQISYCLLVGLVFIHLIHMSLSRYLLDTVFVLAYTVVFHSERENKNVTQNSRIIFHGDLKCMKGHVSMWGAASLWPNMCICPIWSICSRCSSSSVDIKKSLRLWYFTMCWLGGKWSVYSSVVILSFKFFTIPVSVTKSHTYASYLANHSTSLDSGGFC